MKNLEGILLLASNDDNAEAPRPTAIKKHEMRYMKGFVKAWSHKRQNIMKGNTRHIN